jgi:sulfate adenylyltransferase
MIIAPHGGGPLAPRLAPDEMLPDLLREARSLARLPLTSREAADLVMLGIGGFTPLEGFATEAERRSICADMRFPDGLFWPIPITFSVAEDTASGVRPGNRIALVVPDQDELLAILEVRDVYRNDPAFEARTVFGTVDRDHPGVDEVFRRGPVNLGGPVTVLSTGGFKQRYPGLFLTPAETRAIFERHGWRTVVAFQTRNPMHRSHEYLVRIALEVHDGVLIHSLLGNLKAGDIPAGVRVRAIEALIARYLPHGRILNAGYPLDMRYAGPREALLHGVFRQNYGCTHLIVGRDHAGVGRYYGSFEAQEAFDRLPPGSLELQPLKLDWTFWCNACGGMASQRTCPHDEHARVMISGTQVRQKLASGEDLPVEFTRPEVADILKEYYMNAAASEGSVGS